MAAVGLLGYMDLGLMSEHQYGRLAWEELKEALDSTNNFVTAGNEGDSDDEAIPKATVVPEKRRLRFESDLRLLFSTIKSYIKRFWQAHALQALESGGIDDAQCLGRGLVSPVGGAYFYGTLELHRDVGLRALKSFFATAGLMPSGVSQD